MSYLKIYVYLQSKMKDQKGVTMVEYALMIAFIAAACVTAVTLFGTNLLASFTDSAGQMP